MLWINTTGFNAYTQQIDVQAGNNTFDVSLERKKYYEFDSDSGNHGLYLTVSAPSVS